MGVSSRGQPGTDLGKGQAVLPALTRVRGGRPKPWELRKGIGPILRGSGQGEGGEQAEPERDTDRVGQGEGGRSAGTVTSTGVGEARRPASRLGSSFCQRMLRLFQAQPPRPLPPPTTPPSYTGQRQPPPPPRVSALAPAPSHFPAAFATLCWRSLSENGRASPRLPTLPVAAQGAGLTANRSREGRVRAAEESSCFCGFRVVAWLLVFKTHVI